MITLLEDRILVQPIKRQQQATPAGLIIPENVDISDYYNRGKVVAAGPGRMDVTGKSMYHNIRVDDVVVYPQHSGNDIVIDGVKYLVLRATDICGVE